MNAPNESPHTRYGTPLPGLHEGPIPVEPYVSPAFFEKERERLFKRIWLQVARQEDVPNPGDYLVLELELFGAPIILARGEDGAIRAFHSVCPHRGNLVTAHYCSHGNTRSFVCGYHGWTFGTDGRLKSLPGKAYFPDVDPAKLGLKPLACDQWNGFVFIHGDPQPPQSLRAFLGGLADDMEGYPFDQMQRIARYGAEVQVNWKTFVDAFHETYHVGMVHARSLKGCGQPTASSNPWNVPVSARIYPPHHSVTNGLADELVLTPAGALAWQLGMSFSAAQEMPKLPGTNPGNDASWYFDINVFFPNFFCDLGPGWYFTYNFWPIAADRTRWQMDIYQFAAADIGQRVAQEHTKVLLRDLLYEDLSTMETTQRGLESGVLKEMTVSDEMEVAVRHHFTNVMRWVESQ